MNYIGAKNEVCDLYKKELKAHREKYNCTKHVVPFPKGQLDCIISDVKKRRNVDKDIDKQLVRKQVLRKNTRILTPSGPLFPLAAVEPHILQIILAMLEIRESMSAKQCIQFINSAIDGTPSQQKLIENKKD